MSTETTASVPLRFTQSLTATTCFNAASLSGMHEYSPDSFSFLFLSFCKLFLLFTYFHMFRFSPRVCSRGQCVTGGTGRERARRNPNAATARRVLQAAVTRRVLCSVPVVVFVTDPVQLFVPRYSVAAARALFCFFFFFSGRGVYS